jgi:nucleoside-diphosphate kinase
MPTETTLVLIKPDAVARSLTSEILGRFERRGFRLRGLRLLLLDRATAEQHYAEHRERPFFGEFLEGNDAISTVRSMMGETHPTKSAPGTIRGDLALELAENVVHGSDSPESAQRELGLFFGDGLLA